MEERKVIFGQENIRLEGLYANSGGAMGAVISHPHPLMRGGMRNSIVETLAETLFASGGVVPSTSNHPLQSGFFYACKKSQWDS